MEEVLFILQKTYNWFDDVFGKWLTVVDYWEPRGWVIK